MKLTPPSDRKFNDAHASYKAAEQALTSLQGKSEVAAARLLQAKLDLSSTQARIDAFAVDVDFDMKEANKLATKKSESESLCSILESSLGFMDREIAKGKAAIIEAELACTRAQQDFHDSALAQLCEEFLRSNAAAIQKLTQAMHLASLFAQIDGTCTPDAARGLAYRHVEQLFDRVLPTVFDRVFDDAFRKGCAAPTEPLHQPHVSTLVSSIERTNAAAARLHGRSIADALLPRQPEEVTPLDVASAMRAARAAAASAESNRQRAESYRQRLRQHPNDANLISGVEQHERAAKEFDEIVASWDARLQAHQAITT